MSVTNTMRKYGIEQMIRYVYKDPDANLPKLMDWVDNFCGKEFASQRAQVRQAIEDPKHAYYPYIRHMIRDVDQEVLTTLAVNFFLNAGISGWATQQQMRKKYGCNIPWTILLDPTSACNLHCTGCWAAEYGNKLNLSYEEIDSIIGKRGASVRQVRRLRQLLAAQGRRPVGSLPPLSLFYLCYQSHFSLPPFLSPRRKIGGALLFPS